MPNPCFGAVKRPAAGRHVAAGSAARGVWGTAGMPGRAFPRRGFITRRPRAQGRLKRRRKAFPRRGERMLDSPRAEIHISDMDNPEGSDPPSRCLCLNRSGPCADAGTGGLPATGRSFGVSSPRNAPWPPAVGGHYRGERCAMASSDDIAARQLTARLEAELALVTKPDPVTASHPEPPVPRRPASPPAIPRTAPDPE